MTNESAQSPECASAFESSARRLSRVLAADELNVTPAAIGQLVRMPGEMLGVALGRSVLVADDLASDRLVRPFGEEQPFEFAYCIVHRDENEVSPAIAAFNEWPLDEAVAT